MKQAATVSFELLTLSISVVTTFVMLGWLLWRSHYGFDFTDESFYLIWIASPWNYEVSATQFGFIYHVLYRLVGGDIVLLRQFNLLITFGLAWALVSATFRALFKESDTVATWRSLPMFALSAVLASTAPLILAVWWLPTPSYNTLALQALFIAGTGILLAEKTPSKISIGGFALIGIAGWLAFMAKPTTAAALGIVVLAYLVLTGKLKVWLLSISVITAALLIWCSAWIIDGSIRGFIARLADAALMYKNVGAGHTMSQMLRLDEYAFTATEKRTLQIAAMLAFASTVLVSSASHKLRFIGLVIVVGFSAITTAIVCGIIHPALPATQFHGLLIWAMPLGTSLGIFTVMRKRIFSTMSFGRFLLLLCFLTFPYIYVFGTNGNYWNASVGAALFWVLAGIVFLAPASASPAFPRVFLPLAAGAQMLAVALIYVGMEFPYRQTQPLRMNQDIAQLGEMGGKLLVSREYAEYVLKLQNTARAGGFKPGQPMIDLTGHYPGALIAVGAKAIGQPWLVGGYPGSAAFVQGALDRVSCADISSAWILTEPEGKRKLPSRILDRYGIDLSRDYTEVGNFGSPRGAYPSSYEQRLLKPSRAHDSAKKACEGLRS